MSAHMLSAGFKPEWEKPMTPEERQMLAGLFERVGSTAATPRDAQAEDFINDAVRAQPHAPYVLAQTVLVQQQALENASRRLAELEAQAKAAPQEETSFLGSLGKSLFGGGQPAPAPASRNNYDASAYARQSAPDQNYQRPPAYAPPPPAYGQPQQGGPWGAPQQQAPSGGGFMQSALTTAAGVAGGVVLAHSLGSLFGGGNSGGGFGLGGGGLGGGLGGGEVVNNYYEAAPDAAGQHAQDVLQDQDRDQDDAQDAYDDSGSGGDDSSYDT
jgi:hypothetical protein